MHTGGRLVAGSHNRNEFVLINADENGRVISIFLCFHSSHINCIGFLGLSGPYIFLCLFLSPPISFSPPKNVLLSCISHCRWSLGTV